MFPSPFALLLLPLLTGCSDEDLQNAVEDYVMDRYIIKLDSEPAEVVDTTNEIAQAFGLEPIHIFTEATQGFEVDLPTHLVESIEELDEVEYIVLDNTEDLVPDPEEGDGELGDDEVTEAIYRIGGPITDVDYSDIAVAVVDTGVDLDHPDLNVTGAVDIVGESGGEDAGGDDLNGHGTHVAGTIGAIADGEGVAGVAPGVAIHAVRVLDANGSGTYGDIISGLEYVLDNEEIRVVNMSLGGQGSTSGPQPLKEAIQALIEADIVVCIAAGNEASDTAGFIPAGYDEGVVISAYDSDGGDNGFAYFSNYGDEVDIAAPGVNIVSTYPDGDYTALSGTSMATPHVAGAAAAYLAANPSAGPSAVLTALVNSGENDFSGQGGDHSEPLLDVEALMEE